MHASRLSGAKAALLAVLLLAAALRLWVAFAVPSVGWPDEIFQSLEQAHRLVFGYGIVPWEFRTGARSWLLPGFLAGTMEVGRFFGRLGHVRAAQAAMVLLSLIPVGVAFAWARQRLGLLAGVLAGFACATWFELVYFSSRALTGVVAAHLALLALFLASAEAPSKKRLWAAGASLGLSIAIRVHLAPAMAVAMAILCGRSRDRWRSVLAGTAVALAAAGLLDVATGSWPFSSLWANFRYNVIQGESVKFGVQPWYWYFTRLAGIWSWGGLFLLALATQGAMRRPAVGAFAIISALTYAAFAHKEYRFMYPAVVAVVLLASQGLAEILTRVAASTRHRIAVSCAAAGLWAGLSAWRAPDFVSDGSYGRTLAGESLWHQKAGGILAMARLGADPGVCGVGLLVHWAWTGGYTYLHRDVPLYLAMNERMLHEATSAANVMLVPREVAAAVTGFTVEQCWDGMCLAKRPGSCAATKLPPLNTVLSVLGK